MLYEIPVDSNGFTMNGHRKPVTLECASDYPPPAPEPAAAEPQPKWRDAWPAYTHNVSWQDSDSKQHSLTIRCDDIDELLATLTVIKRTVRASKAKAAESQPQGEAPADTQPEPADKPASKPCALHPHALAYRRESKHGGHFYSHRMPDGSWCNGNKAKA